MTRRTSIAFAIAAALWLAGAWPAFAQPVPAAPAVERRRATVAALEAHRAELTVTKRATRSMYAAKTTTVATLKRRRRSWRRDRELRKAMASAQTTAARLAQIDRDLRVVDTRLRAARRALVTAIDAELAAGPSEARRMRLTAWRNGASRKARPRAKKIVLPDLAIDPLATADELADQSALMKKTEGELEREEQLLARREDRYRRMARLQTHRNRADELDVFDDSRPRRNTSRLATTGDDRGAGSGGAESDGASDPAPPSPSGTDEPGPSGDEDGDPSFEGADPTVVLADVVDADTLAAMRLAERSNDPTAKAKAAARARHQVRMRRERLARQRAKVEQRVRALQRSK